MVEGVKHFQRGGPVQGEEDKKLQTNVTLQVSHSASEYQVCRSSALVEGCLSAGVLWSKTQKI